MAAALSTHDLHPLHAVGVVRLGDDGTLEALVERRPAAPADVSYGRVAGSACWGRGAGLATCTLENINILLYHIVHTHIIL